MDIYRTRSVFLVSLQSQQTLRGPDVQVLFPNSAFQKGIDAVKAFNRAQHSFTTYTVNEVWSERSSLFWQSSCKLYRRHCTSAKSLRTFWVWACHCLLNLTVEVSILGVRISKVVRQRRGRGPWKERLLWSLWNVFPDLIWVTRYVLFMKILWNVYLWFGAHFYMNVILP